MKKRAKALVVAGVSGLVVAVAGVSWAWFSENATAAATGGTGGNLSAVTVNATAYDYGSGQSSLFPGHSATVKISVTNPNSVPVYINDVVPAATNPKAATGTTPSQCAGANLQLAADPAFVTDQSGNVIPAGGTALITLTDAVTLDGPTTGQECEGMTFTTNWTVSAINQ